MHVTGCGEKTVLRAIDAVTEAYMRPLYHAKADRLTALADRLQENGPRKLTELRSNNEEHYARFRRAVEHLVIGFGGEDELDTDARIAARGPVFDSEIVTSLVAVLKQEAFNHRYLQAVDGRLANGMAVMAMAAHTGCDSVFGSTPPNNPHSYPWMNSLFQDGITIGWLMSESFIVDHARRSVIPERLATALLDRLHNVLSAHELSEFTHSATRR